MTVSKVNNTLDLLTEIESHHLKEKGAFFFAGITLLAAGILAAFALQNYLDYIDLRIKTNWIEPDYEGWHRLCVNAQSYFAGSLACMAVSCALLKFAVSHYHERKSKEGMVCKGDLHEMEEKIEQNKKWASRAKIGLITGLAISLLFLILGYDLHQSTLDTCWNSSIWDILGKLEWIEQQKVIEYAFFGTSGFGAAVALGSFIIKTISKANLARNEIMKVMAEEPIPSLYL